MRKPTILIAERDALLRRQLKQVLSSQEFETTESSDKLEACKSLPDRRVDLVILGPSQGGAQEGLELVKGMRRAERKVPIILIAANSSEELAIAALRAGVTDYLKHPCAAEELVSSVRRSLADPPPPLPAPPGKAAPLEPQGPRMIGESAPMREIKASIGKIARTDSNVLITGETGTGKELVAELIHSTSPRHNGPYVSINCSAIPDSLLESELFGYERGAFTGAYTAKAGNLKLADRGTIFFDEISEMSPPAQAKILRAIESKEIQRLGGRRSVPVDVRIIAATNQDPEDLLAQGKFRKDLYYRLNVSRVHLPPLRDRKEDIPLLYDHYIGQLNRRFGQDVQGLTAEVVEALLRYDWPGNVRELRNLLEAVLVNGPSQRICLLDLPQHFHKRLREGAGLPQDERDRLLAALFSTKWNKSKAAQRLHWSRMTLYRKLAKYDITRSHNPTAAGTPVPSERSP